MVILLLLGKLISSFVIKTSLVKSALQNLSHSQLTVFS